MTTKPRIFLAVAFLCFALAPVAALGWGSKGHAMCARIASRRMPQYAPAFFRNAVERLAYLSSDPDRWRSSSSQALSHVNAPDHYFDLEVWGTDQFPNSRYDLIVLAIKKGIIHYDPLAAANRPGTSGGDRFVSDLGTAPYAVAETAAKLVSTFRDWRDCSEDTLVKGQIEESVIYLAGVLAHYVTDLGNPLHCTVHFNGWAQEYPNPKNYPVGRAASEIHARFEEDYVDRSIDEKDIEPLILPARSVSSWISDMEKFIRHNNAFVEQLYTLDKAGAFGSGNEPQGAKPFVAGRLAEAASMLRDVWTAAWELSGDEWLNGRAVLYPRERKTVLQLLRERYRIQTIEHDGKIEVVSIGNRKNGIDGRVWQMYVNNRRSDSGRPVDTYIPAAGERIDFRFEKPAADQKNR